MVGPLNIKEAAKPLPPDLEEFVSNSGRYSFIIVSFGSNVASILQRPVVDMLATAFGKLKQRIVWRLKGQCSKSNARDLRSRHWNIERERHTRGGKHARREKAKELFPTTRDSRVYSLARAPPTRALYHSSACYAVCNAQ